MSFEEGTQMPDVPAGGDELAVKTDREAASDAQPSVESTDRYGLQAQNKGYLLRKYNIAMSKAGLPYFEPIQSTLKLCIRDAPDALDTARGLMKKDKKLQVRLMKLIDPAAAYLKVRFADAGKERAWLARSLVIWPLTNQVGYHLYKATSGEADLLDFGTYLIRTDANVNKVDDLAGNVAYQKRAFWTDLAFTELAVVDALVQEIDSSSADYNLEAIIRAGYQSSANLDTRNHLRGIQGNDPVTEDTATTDIKAQILASRRAVTSQAA